MDISTSAVRDLREKTGAGVMDCKRALVEAGGDVARAMEILRQQGLARAGKKAARVATQGVIDCYVHAGGRIGAMIELNCETDFVARTDDFRQLAHDLAMQVAATNPRYVSPDEVPAEATEDRGVICLTSQPFIKDPSLTVQDLITRLIAKIGENIRVRRFARFELGAE
ncbi:MAG: translation elongation factor Ts [Chloroflexi bacterium]|nr:translation elongation factor Ts [Chloroflexota bacterium]